ncbi:MAG: hypothetical protein WDW36_000558 [Sanguina aurantia]
MGSAAVVFGVQNLRYPAAVAPPVKMDMKWYDGIKKPRWNPPKWAFPAVWIPLKLMQVASLFLVLKKTGFSGRAVLPFSIFGAHLLLGNRWNVIFFGEHKLRRSLDYMAIFYGSIAATAAAFYPISPAAAVLMMPTQVWVTIAAALNYSIVQLNKDSPDPSFDKPSAPAPAS